MFVGLYNRCLRVQSGGQSVESCASFASSIGQNNDLFPVAWQVRDNEPLSREFGQGHAKTLWHNRLDNIDKSAYFDSRSCQQHNIPQYNFGPEFSEILNR